jgi:hypothetical protein
VLVCVVDVPVRVDVPEETEVAVSLLVSVVDVSVKDIEVVVKLEVALVKLAVVKVSLPVRVSVLIVVEVV